MAGLASDPIIQNFREQIAAIDLKLVEALNARIKLVKELKNYKESQGLSFYDAAQEERVITRLCRANPGPISDEGLQELFGYILEWAKREATKGPKD